MSVVNSSAEPPPKVNYKRSEVLSFSSVAVLQIQCIESTLQRLYTLLLMDALTWLCDAALLALEASSSIALQSAQGLVHGMAVPAPDYSSACS